MSNSCNRHGKVKWRNTKQKSKRKNTRVSNSAPICSKKNMEDQAISSTNANSSEMDAALWGTDQVSLFSAWDTAEAENILKGSALELLDKSLEEEFKESDQIDVPCCDAIVDSTLRTKEKFAGEDMINVVDQVDYQGFESLQALDQPTTVTQRASVWKCCGLLDVFRSLRHY